MMNMGEMDANGRRFLMELYQQTGGDSAVQVSMYEIGEAVEMERRDAAKMAEELIGLGFVAVKTLSGGIGITDDGVAEAHQMVGGAAAAAAGSVNLSDGPVLDEAGCRAVERVVALLKTQAGENSWEFECLTELMADLKTIDAQMISPRPKTAILRECFRSIQEVLEKAGNSDSLAQVKQLMGTA